MSLAIVSFGALGKEDGYSTTTSDQLEFRYKGDSLTANALNEYVLPLSSPAILASWPVWDESSQVCPLSLEYCHL